MTPATSEMMMFLKINMTLWDAHILYKIRRNACPRELPNQEEGAIDPAEFVEHLDEQQIENYYPMFLRVDEDNADFWNDENIANMLGPLNLQDEL